MRMWEDVIHVWTRGVDRRSLGVRAWWMRSRRDFVSKFLLMMKGVVVSQADR